MEHNPTDAAARQRISTACEACRANKIRCQPSEQPGVCRKCLSSKRECISRTGPRTRRSKRAKLLEQASALQTNSPLEDAGSSAPPPPGPSTTFSIDFEFPAPTEVDESFESLKENHARFVESLFPVEEVEPDPWHWASSAVMTDLQSPPESTTHSHSIEDLTTKPSFNLASAESLLTLFRSMLDKLPCIILSEDATVAQLARTRPFVLLAILAAASGSKSLQGHSLYDEEFRKVLGLKFVAGGERSLELLQGILIYCAWYPFHLRPRNKQAYQYIRMASDIIHDMELDQEFTLGMLGDEVTETQLEGIRAYLSFHYSITTFVLAWRKHKTLSMTFSPWTATCCDILERNAQAFGDSVLASLVRSTNAMREASDLIHERGGQTEHQSRLILIGLEAQIAEIHGRIPQLVRGSIAIQMQIIFVDIYLDGGALLKLPRAKPSATGNGPIPPLASKLPSCVRNINKYFDLVLTLNEAAILGFSIVDWTRLILTVIVAVRLSFPLLECPAFDSSSARSELKLVEFLGKLCSEADLAAASKRVDVLSASRIVLSVVKEKYERQTKLHDAKLATPSYSTPRTVQGCPMLDGSMDQYIPTWDPGYGKSFGSSPITAGQSSSTNNDQIFHDLWATMTMGWAGEDPSINPQS